MLGLISRVANDFRRFASLSVALGVIAYTSSVSAEMIELHAVADTTLFESSPNDNMGGWTHFAAGTTGSAGDVTKNRGLLRFDLVGKLPPGAQISNVNLILRVTRVPESGRRDSTFALHRVLKDWGEGNKLGDRGFPASEGEATWNSRFHTTNAVPSPLTNLWSVPGLLAETDYDTNVVDSRLVGGFGAYTWGPTPRMIADLNEWIANPETNFGWLLVSQSEGTAKTARGFGSREEADNQPLLRIVYSVPAPLEITSPTIQGGHVRFTFNAQADQSYQVEYVNDIQPGNIWNTLTNITAAPHATNAVVNDALNASFRFYRVTTP